MREVQLFPDVPVASCCWIKWNQKYAETGGVILSPNIPLINKQRDVHTMLLILRLHLITHTIYILRPYFFDLAMVLIVDYNHL